MAKSKEEKSKNPMREVKIEKVTVNIGVGGAGDRLELIKGYIENLLSATFVKTKARTRNPTFKIRKGDVIGLKATFRGPGAVDVVNRSLASIRGKIKESYFDRQGNFSFGVKEYIEFPGAKYDPAIGLFGFDVCVTFKRAGYGVVDRKIKTSKVPKSHMTTKPECLDFVKKNFKVQFV